MSGETVDHIYEGDSDIRMHTTTPDKYDLYALITMEYTILSEAADGGSRRIMPRTRTMSASCEIGKSNTKTLFYSTPLHSRVRRRRR
jgi:hypothetical protein